MTHDDQLMISDPQGPLPGMRPMPGVHPGQGQPGQEKGRGAMGYLMPVYTVAILILFVYTAMKVCHV